MGVAVKTNVRRLLRQYGLRPDKRLGQHFLADARLLARIAEAAELTPQDTVVEIGAGIGNLTRHLAARAGRVIAVEIDPRLRLPLLHQTEDFPNVEPVFADFLELDLQQLVGQGPYVVVGNLPYVITSPIFHKLLEEGPRPTRMTVLVQKEVAERIAAGPGKMNLLGLAVQVHGRPEVLFTVPSGAFVPPPQVASALVRVDMYPQPLLPEPRRGRLFRLARAAFGQRRKQLVNTLAPLLGGKDRARQVLEQAGVSPSARPEDLGLEDWLRLLQAAEAAGFG